MDLQANQSSDLKIPRIVPFLADAVHQLNGQQSEGIFRVPGDADDVTDLVSQRALILIVSISPSPFLY